MVDFYGKFSINTPHMDAVGDIIPLDYMLILI